MKQLNQHDAMLVSGGVSQSSSPSLVGIGVSVDSLPMPTDPVSVPELF